MTRFSWWHVAVGVTVLALAAAVASEFATSPGTTVGAWVCLGVLGAGYALFGWRSFTAADPAQSEFAAQAQARRESFSGPAFALLAIACTSVGVAFDPNLAILQAITFPIIWFSVDPLWRAVVLNVLLATGVTGGFIVSLGFTTTNVIQSLVIETISLLFSLALGLWFSFALAQGQQNTRLLAELQAAQGELAVLSRDSGILSERQRLAGEIHDTIAQSLTGLVMVAQRTRSQLPDDQLDARENLTLIEDIARDALVETRALVAASAPIDGEGGLLPALDRLIARFTRETAVQIELDSAEYAAQSNEVEVVLLRAAQEALANVRKHSGATRVRMRLRVGGGAADAAGGSSRAGGGVVGAEGDGTVQLIVSDNGSGLDAAHPISEGFGLSGMQQRLSILGGTMRVGQSGAGGVELTVALPVAVSPEAAERGAMPAGRTTNGVASGAAAESVARENGVRR